MEKRPRRFRVDRVVGEWVSVNGPDYEREAEHRVVDVDSGEVVFVFTESGDWPYMCECTFTGAATVVVAPDHQSVRVTDHNGSVKDVPLPG